MIKENIDELIKQSMKSQFHKRTEVLRAIKNEFLKWETAKNAKPLDDAVEIAILNKMVKQRQESLDAYTKANRKDLASNEQAELEIIQGFLPQKATFEEIVEVLKEQYNTLEIPKKEMGAAIKYVKSKLTNVDGKELSEIVKKYLV